MYKIIPAHIMRTWLKKLFILILYTHTMILKIAYNCFFLLYIQWSDHAMGQVGGSPKSVHIARLVADRRGRDIVHVGRQLVLNAHTPTISTCTSISTPPKNSHYAKVLSFSLNNIYESTFCNFFFYANLRDRAFLHLEMTIRKPRRSTILYLYLQRLLPSWPAVTL